MNVTNLMYKVSHIYTSADPLPSDVLCSVGACQRIPASLMSIDTLNQDIYYYSVLVSVSFPKALYHLESDNIFPYHRSSC